MPDRLSPEIFEIPYADIRMGYRSAVYFNRAKQIMRAERPDQRVTMQVFQKKDSILCGIDEALAILRTCSGEYREPETAAQVFNLYVKQRQKSRAYRTVALNETAEFVNEEQRYTKLMREQLHLEKSLEQGWVSAWDDLNVYALHDGDEIKPWEPVMVIEGPYAAFAHLESVYLGILARQTKIATNVRRVVDACNGKDLLFFADRFDHYYTQGGDGYASKIGGAKGVATNAMGAWWGDPGMGTMPHALIAAYNGSTLDAAEAYTKTFPDSRLIVLVDFDNDCAATALECARRFGDRLWGVRLDTSESMVDASITMEDMGDFSPTGVNPVGTWNVRRRLDSHGFQGVKIVVSGGFTAEKINRFESLGVPVDAYAVGSSLLQGSNDFTADIVAPTAKRGRWGRDASRLERVQ